MANFGLELSMQVQSREGLKEEKKIIEAVPSVLGQLLIIIIQFMYASHSRWILNRVINIISITSAHHKKHQTLSRHILKQGLTDYISFYFYDKENSSLIIKTK